MIVKRGRKSLPRPSRKRRTEAERASQNFSEEEKKRQKEPPRAFLRRGREAERASQSLPGRRKRGRKSLPEPPYYPGIASLLSYPVYTLPVHPGYTTVGHRPQHRYTARAGRVQATALTRALTELSLRQTTIYRYDENSLPVPRRENRAEKRRTLCAEAQGSKGGRRLCAEISLLLF